MVSEAERQYIAGFIDAEGCISVEVRRDDTMKIGYGVRAFVKLETSAPYVAGFLDGDGYITALIKPSSRLANGFHFEPVIAFNTNSDGRPAVIEFLERYCKDIGVKCRVAKVKSIRKFQRKEMYRFEVTGTKSVKKFLESIVDYLIVKKQKALIMLNYIIPILERGEHRECKKKFIELMEFVDALSSYATKGRKRKYTADYFKSLWNDELDIKITKGRKKSAIYKDRKWLQKKYHEEGLSLREIASLCGTYSSVIHYWVKKFGLQKRGEK